MDLYIDFTPSELLLECLRSSKSLHTLKLTMGWTMGGSREFASTLSLDGLTTLHLNRVTIERPIQEIILCFRALENLFLKDCRISEKFEISKCKLKNLTVKFCFIPICIIQVSAPTLVSFNWIGCSSEHPYDYYLESLSSLVVASIPLCLARGCSVMKVLNALYHAEVIELSHIFDVESICRGDLLGNLPTFGNLKYLMLEPTSRFNDSHVRVIGCLLRHSPNLKALVIDYFEPSSRYFRSTSKPRRDELNRVGEWIFTSLAYKCFNHLELIEFRNLVASVEEMNQLATFAKQGRATECHMKKFYAFECFEEFLVEYDAAQRKRGRW